MAKKPEPPQKSSSSKNHHLKNNGSRNKTKTQNKNKTSTSSSTKAKTKIKNTAVDDEPQLLVASSSDDDDELNETDGDDNEEKETLKSIKKRRAKRELKNKSKNKDVDHEDAALYRFPMNRISRIIKSEDNNYINNNSDLKIAQEAVFLINRASEKFLELLSKEAYACAFLDRKHHVSYDHMSSVVSKRSRLSFISDFVPEKVKAEDALAQIPEAEK